jgi:DNA-binding transcriptional MerR regulator
MRISELADETGVALHTLKYYLREGVLMPGVATSRTRAEYAAEHVERVRLVRALVESGGLGIAGVRAVLETLDHPPDSRHEFLGAAHLALPSPHADHVVDGELRAVIERLGWRVYPDSPVLGTLSAALAGARAAGISVSPAHLERYARAAWQVAEVDLDVATEARTPAEALTTVTVGTVMLDPVLVALRRLAQQAVSASREEVATMKARSRPTGPPQT